MGLPLTCAECRLNNKKWHNIPTKTEPSKTTIKNLKTKRNNKSSQTETCQHYKTEIPLHKNRQFKLHIQLR